MRTPDYSCVENLNYEYVFWILLLWKWFNQQQFFLIVPCLKNMISNCMIFDALRVMEVRNVPWAITIYVILKSFNHSISGKFAVLSHSTTNSRRISRIRWRSNKIIYLLIVFSRKAHIPLDNPLVTKIVSNSYVFFHMLCKYHDCKVSSTTNAWNFETEYNWLFP